jgi:hypothetical protein
MENVRCQDGAQEALLENYRALGTVVSIIGRHLPRPTKQVPRLYVCGEGGGQGGRPTKNRHISEKDLRCVIRIAVICYKSSGKIYYIHLQTPVNRSLTYVCFLANKIV